jgi:hypothetical protein
MLNPGRLRRTGPMRDWTEVGKGMSQTGTYLLHDAGLALGEGDVATRLVGDELDLDFSSLAATLVIVVVVVVGDALSRALGATALSSGRGAIADGVGIVELDRRLLIVLISDVGHYCRDSAIGITRESQVSVGMLL